MGMINSFYMISRFSVLVRRPRGRGQRRPICKNPTTSQPTDAPAMGIGTALLHKAAGSLADLTRRPVVVFFLVFFYGRHFHVRESLVMQEGGGERRSCRD